MKFGRKRKAGVAYIPDRAELNEANRPAREAAESKKRPRKVRK